MRYRKANRSGRQFAANRLDLYLIKSGFNNKEKLKQRKRKDCDVTMTFEHCLERSAYCIAILCIVGIFSDICTVEGTHFRGGTITWSPSANYNASFRQVTFTFRLSWQHSHVSCDNDTISSGRVIGDHQHQWSCLYGCTGSVGSTAIRCNAFSLVGGYTEGFNTFQHIFQDDGPFDISYMYCCWTETQVTGNSSRWGLTTNLLLGDRSDTSGPNHAPVVHTPLTMTLEPGVNAALRLNVTDTDHDVIRCRIGRLASECGSICSLSSNFSLDQENCQLLFRPSSNATGRFAIALLVEDFHRQDSPIRIGDRYVRSNQPISTVPFQFIIDVEPLSDLKCSNMKPHVEVSRKNTTSSVLRPNQLFQADVTVQTCDERSRVSHIELSGPQGTSRSDPFTNEEGRTQLTLSWRPKQGQLGLQSFCAIAVQDNGLRSEEECFTVFVDAGMSYCRGIGGTQYITFDGMQYSFVGGCQYQLSLTTFNPAQVVGQDLQPFNISVSNVMAAGKDRPNINTIFVTVMGHNIEIHRNRRLTINGVQVFPPVRLTGINVDISGRFIVVTTNSGLSLRYDGISSYVIGLPYQYRNHVTGLCGNFNGNGDDDSELPDRDGFPQRKFPNEVAAHFQIDNGRCRQTPLRDEVKCPNQRVAINSAVCGVITEKNGCFGSCHDVVDPTPFFESCMNAMCTSAYSISTLDAQIGAYADACRIGSAQICDWRQRIGAGLECPPNSRYSPCGPSKPKTCMDLNGEDAQPGVCMEGCVCDQGFVLSGEDCVPESQCGCFIQGSYRLPGFSFQTNDCAFQCTCVEQNKTTCTAAPPCAPNERCGILDNGFNGCTARMEAPATCKIFGDPHYCTFDGVTYDSMSTCAHILVRSKSDSMVVPFTVIGVNAEPRINNTVSHVREVQIRVGGNYNLTIILSEGPVIRLNGDVTIPGSSFRGVQFRMTSSFLVVTFDFGMVIRWDGVDRLRISAWGPLRRQVEGLCGNFDGNPTNDFLAANGGGLITNIADFVNSWIATGQDANGVMFPEPYTNATEACLKRGLRGKSLADCILVQSQLPSCRERSSAEQLLAPPCEEKPERLESHRNDCSILVDPQGPFAPCHSIFDPFTAYSNCVFDLCAYEGNATFRERILDSFDYDCRERNITIRSWRSRMDRPMDCGRSSVFSECVRQCVDACDDPEGRKCRENLDMGEFCEEGCQCLEGYVRSPENNCVPKEECGCIINGMYKLKGFTYRTNNCSSECECVGDGRVMCRPVKPCRIRLKCVEDKFGFQRCDGRLRRRATCKAVTDPHYMTFDGTRYDSMGTCAYTMVRNRAGSTGPSFHVIAVNENPLPGQIVSHVRDVIVLFGENQRMTFHQGPRILYNGIQIFPGTEMSGFVVRKAGRFTVVEFDFRLVIRWDGKDRLRISAWQPLRNMVEGLCGDFDDDPSNDFQTSWGEVTNDLTTFVRSWEVYGYNTSGCVLPPPQNVSEICRDGDNLARYGRECSVLTDPDGPFNHCHEEVSPWPSYRDCVYDLCIYNGSSVQKDRIFTSYIADCEGANRPPNTDWREIANLTTTCPEHMHYNATSAPCQPTCTDPNGSRCMASENRDSDIEEGCECDEGFILSGEVCVPVEECGCMIDGRYFPRGFAQRNKDCSQECVCVGNNDLECYDAPPCPKRSKCKIDDNGFRKCVLRPRRRATCKAVTDPHYMTFDGTTYDSMGMCSYIMVQSKSNASVPPFRVVAVNEQPEPHRIVSHVKEVFVHFGDNMTMHFAARKVIKLNGLVVNPGYKKDGIEIRTAGRFTVVHWEWGLVVRWDGEDRLRISAWSPLRYQVEGLCGDFDDNRDNDLYSRSGEPFPDIDTFVNSWIIEGYGAEGCPDEGPSDRSPPGCDDPAILNTHRNACYVLIDPEGPMKDCQSVAEAQTSFDACVYDQCAYNGDPSMKDRIMSSYKDTCLDEDEENREDNDTDTMKPPPWRPMANLTDPECPPNSHYNICISQCQPSCDDPDGSICARSNALGRACVDGCQADEGYLKSGESFVTPFHCGCLVDGTYYMDGQSYLTESCDNLCNCNEGNVRCQSIDGCRRNQECRADDEGKLACLPYRTATCERNGNGHYTSFDKYSFSFSGVCEYILAQPSSHSPDWTVTVETEATETNTTVVRTVSLLGLSANLSIILTRSVGPVVIEVNSVPISNMWSSSYGDTEISVQTQGRFAIITSSMGKRIEFDGNQLLFSLPVFMRNKVTGLCGNFNGLASDDRAAKNGSIVNSVEEFAASHQTRECISQLVTTLCTEEHNVTGRTSEYCGLITNITGPLRPCNRIIPFSVSRRHFEQCAEDYCASAGNKTILEQAIQSYTHECLKQGVRICDWRETTGFTTSCSPNMHYDGCASSCPSMCGQIPQNSSCPMLESCVCNDGYVMQDGICIPLQSCGCLVNSVQRSYGESFLSSNCSQLCTCYGEETIRCQDSVGCRINQICQVSGGEEQCVRRPKTRASCSSVNGYHFNTFDGRQFSWPATCSYVMVRSVSGSFSVTASYSKRPENAFPRLSVITVVFDDGSHMLSMYANGTAQVDGATLRQDDSAYGVERRRVGFFHVITIPSGIVVRWNLNGRLEINAWRDLRGEIEGLCGDFDDEPVNDITNDVGDYVQQWEADNQNNSCTTDVESETKLPEDCDAKAAARNCSFLDSPSARFALCHELLSPRSYYQSCLVDACRGGTDAANRVIASYVRDCVNEGGPHVAWRNRTDCPDHASYSECTSQCHATCSDRNAATCQSNRLLGDECVEGCQCEYGYVMDAGRCIATYNCGCITSSGFYVKANTSVMLDGCTQMCRCEAGNLTCSTTSCDVGQYCGVRDREYGCHWIDECEYENGGCSHSCEHNDGVTTCSCPPGYSLNRDNKTCNKSQDEERIECEDGETERERLARWREATFNEWTNKLRMYITTFSTSFTDPQAVATVCGHRWTTWLDRDNPGGVGDVESLDLLQHEYPHKICKNPVAIEARLADGRPATASGNHVTMSAETGLRCINAEQREGVKCSDFQVRFLCLDTLV